MEVNDFIGALLNFIPPKNCKIVQYYGLYSRRSKIDLRDLIDQLVKWYRNFSIYNIPLLIIQEETKLKTRLFAHFVAMK